ncbi:MAG: phenylalanine--tRNA ligase subunit beta [Nanoarchaeota archaeon]
MAVITIPVKEFEKEIGKLDEKMQERIAMFGTPVDSINEKDLQIEIFPNRPDLLSYQGFKRSFLAFLGKKTGIKSYKVLPPKKDYEVNIDSSVKDIRPFTACAIIQDLKLDDAKIKEIIDLQEKIHATYGRKRKKAAIGIYPLEKIKLPINYKALEPEKIKFTPLEYQKEMSGLEILQKHPAGKEHSHLLAGKIKFPVFTDSEDKIMSMPPIINSETTGKITTKTKDVFVECSGYDLETLKKCLNIIAATLADMGGIIYQMKLKYAKPEITPNLDPKKEKISLDSANKLLGLELNEKDMKKLLEKMGHEYEKGQASVPAWRIDIIHEVDLIEDIAIAYGYENFKEEIPKISTIGQENKKESMKRKIAEILEGIEALEVSNYHLTIKRDQFEKMNSQEKQTLQVKGSKTEYNILRKNLAHYILKNFSENVDSEYPQKIFEIGKTFESENENEKLALGMSPGNFTEIKQALEYLARMLNIHLEIKEPNENLPWFIDGRSAEICIKNKPIGFLGEIHPKILKNWKIKMPAALYEIDLEEIFKEFI